MKGESMMNLREEEKADILQRLTRVETKLELMANAKDVAGEARQSVKTAHKRLDELASNQNWLWRTVITALLVGGINLIWKFIGR
jgi:hypothetical protein